MHFATRHTLAALGALATLLALGACSTPEEPAEIVEADAAPEISAVDPSVWPDLSPPPLDSDTENRITEIMALMTLEQKVGQVIQADSNSVTPEEVKQYRLGSILSGGNSAPGDEPYADAAAWLEAADAYFEASIDPEGVEIAIPLIWGIDAVHGHANLTGATVFPHNIGLGAARDPDLIQEVMEVTAAELIVSGHDWTFAPTLAVPRDDRWGRTYGVSPRTPKSSQATHTASSTASRVRQEQKAFSAKPTSFRLPNTSWVMAAQPMASTRAIQPLLRLSFAMCTLHLIFLRLRPM